MITFRQGDVFLVKCDNIPNELEKINRDEKNRIVLAYGEITGHAHAIKNKNACLFLDKNHNKFYLIVSNPVELIHEEHNKIILPVGNYEVIRQREYTPYEIIKVED